MDEHIRKNDEEIAEMKRLLVEHLQDENVSVPALKGEINGQLVKIYTDVGGIHEILERQNETMEKFTTRMEKQNEVMEAFTLKVEKHIEVVEPYITGIEGGKSVGKVIMWAGGIIVALAAIRTSLISLIK